MDSRPRKTKVIQLTDRQRMLLESATDWIQNNYPEAGLVGVAWWFFDCGCMAGMGFSLEAGIATPAVRVDRALVEDEAVPECSKCLENNSTNPDKTFKFGTAWLRPVLDSKNRDRIKKELFGPLLDNEAVELYQQGEVQAAH